MAPRSKRPRLMRSRVSLTHKALDPYWNKTDFTPDKGDSAELPMLRAVRELARVLTIYGHLEATRVWFEKGVEIGEQQLKGMEE